MISRTECDKFEERRHNKVLYCYYAIMACCKVRPSNDVVTESTFLLCSINSTKLSRVTERRRPEICFMLHTRWLHSTISRTECDKFQMKRQL